MKGRETARNVSVSCSCSAFVPPSVMSFWFHFWSKKSLTHCCSAVFLFNDNISLKQSFSLLSGG
jgi:hypothetical protein